MPKPPDFFPEFSGKLPVENQSRQIYWEYYGKKDKEAICLLNGLAMDTRAWMSSISHVHPEFDVLLFNYFGQEGPEKESSCENEEYHIHKFCDYLAAIMDTLEMEKIHLLGVSYGGFVGGEFARLHPTRLYTATVSGILFTYEIGFQNYQDLSLRFYTQGEKVFEVYTHYMYEKIFGDPFLEKIYGESMEKMRINFFQRYKDKRYCLVRLTEAQIPFFRALRDNPQLYSEIEIPMLILAGENDRAVPTWYQEKIHHIVKDSRYITIPNCGHLTYLERPDIFWPNVIAFMKSKKTNFKEV